MEKRKTTMKKRPTRIVDLHYDIFKEILIRVASSSNGAKNLANAISVCQDFRQFVEDRDVLRAVAFDNLSISGCWELFQSIGGLIARSAKAGHAEAQLIMAKIIIVTTSQLLNSKGESTGKEASSVQATDDVNNLSEEISRMFRFIANFVPDQTYPVQSTDFFHFDFVRLFLSRARLSDVIEMLPYIKDYLVYFCGRQGKSVISELNLVVMNLSSLETDVEFIENYFAEILRGIYLSESHFMHFFGMKIEQRCMKEVWAKEKDTTTTTAMTTTTMMERIDVSMKRVRTALAIVEEETHKFLQRFAEHTSLCSSLLLQVREEAALVEDEALIIKAEVLHMQVQREDLVSEFDALMSACHK